MKHSAKMMSSAVTALVLGSASLGVSASTNPFGFDALENGYQQIAPEGKCGGEKKEEGERKEKGKEGKCGEGKCGEEKREKAKEKVTTEKSEEGKCGEGKCGEGKCGS